LNRVSLETVRRAAEQAEKNEKDPADQQHDAAGAQRRDQV